MALIAFIAPLLGINRRLRDEKSLALQRLGISLEQVLRESTRFIQEQQLERVAALRTASGTLREHQQAVREVATWPWSPGSLRNLVLPILLPLLISILQRYVIGLLGF